MKQNKCQCSRCRQSNRDDDVRVHPTRQVVNNHTNVRTVKNIHPTEVKNVYRTIQRNENYYPVTESDVNETVVENYDCGSDVNNSNNCRRVNDSNHCGNGNNGNSGNNNSCEKKHPCNSRQNRNWLF